MARGVRTFCIDSTPHPMYLAASLLPVTHTESSKKCFNLNF